MRSSRSVASAEFRVCLAQAAPPAESGNSCEPCGLLSLWLLGRSDHVQRDRDRPPAQAPRDPRRRPLRPPRSPGAGNFGLARSIPGAGGFETISFTGDAATAEGNARRPWLTEGEPGPLSCSGACSRGGRSRTWRHGLSQSVGLIMKRLSGRSPNSSRASRPTSKLPTRWNVDLPRVR